MDYTINEPSIVTESDVSQNTEGLEYLLKKHWKVYHSSLFDVDPKTFMEKSLAVNRHLNDANLRKKNLTYKVHLNVCPELRSSEMVTEGLKVEVFLNGTNVVYTGYFLNWSNKVEERTHLPLLLVSGNARLCRSVHTALANTFFCTIRDLDFTQDNLITLFALLVNLADKRDEKATVKLKYHLPGLEKTNDITASFSVRGLSQIFKFYKDIVQSDVGQQISSFFYGKVLTHVGKKFSMDFSCAKLSKVTFPDAVANEGGEISLRCPIASQVILSAIHSFLDGLPPAPALSIPSGSS